jgi:predicted ATP-grasp superfamily ATP-dependent carboligase
LLQVRTPIANNFYEEFANELIGFAKNEGIKSVVILSSTFSYEQHFIGKNPFEYLQNEKAEKCDSLAAFNSSTAVDKKLPGSGVALALFETATANELKAVILYKYTSEGDNRPDAFELTKRVNEYLKKPIQGEIKEPTSWKFLFGGHVNPELY